MGDFRPEIISTQVPADKLAALAKGHHGTVKVVVDIARKTMAAGGEWHSDCLKLLTAEGSDPADCWGAKLDTETGKITYKSQINQDRPDNRLDEIHDESIRAAVREMVDRYLRLA